MSLDGIAEFSYSSCHGFVESTTERRKSTFKCINHNRSAEPSIKNKLSFILPMMFVLQKELNRDKMHVSSYATKDDYSLKQEDSWMIKPPPLDQ